MRALYYVIESIVEETDTILSDKGSDDEGSTVSRHESLLHVQMDKTDSESELDEALLQDDEDNSVDPLDNDGHLSDDERPLVIDEEKGDEDINVEIDEY